jgi:methylmalonyl-CoA mutase N-terminal domain/subunit
MEREQVERVQALRKRRNAGKTQSALAELGRRAGGGGNLLPAILNAVEHYATVGEISDTLRRVFGEYQESVVL